ncbi:MAG TPA: phosphate ABC transporter permease subunit PstC [Acidimicrobiales bacterium]|jgi:phosphate transport system permease protein|nr:phosphate ABC transporter permease subunit PstC [Acidimicrobiales bacterium]
MQTIEKSTAGGRSEPPADRPPAGQRGDRIFAGLTTGVSVAILALLVVMMLFLFGKAWPALHKAGLAFFTERQWFPDAPKPRFGVEALVWGTVVSSVLALLIAVPVAVASALYVTEYARPVVGRWVGYLVDVLAAVPSVVYGLWGLYFLVPRMVGFQRWLGQHLGFIPIFHNPENLYGRSILAASVVLALMVLPIVAAVSREVFRQVPREMREAALALGATRWETVRMSVLPQSRSGIIGAVILGLGRALGETIAVALVLAVTFDVNIRILRPGGNTVAANIATKFGEAGVVGRSALIASGLVLFLITLLATAGARSVVRRTGRAATGLA